VNHIIVTTSFEVPGYEIEQVLGIVRGVTVRTRGMFYDMWARFQMMLGGEVTPYSEMCEKARSEAMERMLEDARLRGADAVIMVRYDSSSGEGGYTEFVCYGTAVRLRPAGGMDRVDHSSEIRKSQGE